MNTQEDKFDHPNLQAESGETNAFCVILGRPGTDPLSVIGPYSDEASATAEVQAHEDKGIQAVLDILINPANL